jgi:hypothetical protein
MTMMTELENNIHKSDSYAFCKKIFSSSNEIQSVELINKKGRLVERISNGNTVNLPPHKKEMFHMSSKLQESMKNEYDDDFGKVNYSYVSRERVAIFSFGVGEDILIITLPNTVNPHPIAKEIISFLSGDILTSKPKVL